MQNFAILLTSVSIILIAIVVYRIIFVCKGQKLKDIQYKSSNIIIQRLKKGSRKTVVVIGNGWHVDVSKQDRVTKHDNFFVIPKEEMKLLSEKQWDYEILADYYTCETAGLEEAGKELANFLNQNYKGYRIIMIGHSKSGVDFANDCKYLKASDKQVKIFTVASSFSGIESIEKSTANMKKWQQWIFQKIWTPHKTNNDITCGSDFLTNVANFSGLQTREFYQSQTKLPEICLNPADIFFKWLDCITKTNGDGMVGFKNQKLPGHDAEVLYCNHQSAMQKAIKKWKQKGYFNP